MVFGFWLTLVVLVANAAVSLYNMRKLIRNEARVRGTHLVLTELEATLSTMKDAETGQRGFIITGDPRYLEPYEAAVARIGERLAALKSLLSDNEDQQRRLALLERSVRLKLDELKQTIDLWRHEGAEAAREAVLAGRGKKEMDDLRSIVDEMREEEDRLLRQRAAESQASVGRMIFTFLLATLLAAVTLTLFYARGRRYLKEREQAEEALRSSTEWLQTTLRSIGDAVIATDAAGQITFMNGVAQALTGWTEDEARGRDLREVFKIVNEETRGEVENPVARVLREGVVVGLANHTMLIARNGREVPIDDSGAPIKDREGNIAGVVLVFHDTTERRQAEHQLRESEARYRLLFESNPMPMWVYDLETLRFVAINEAAIRQYGYTREEFLAMTIKDIRPAEDVPDLLRRVESLSGGLGSPGQWHHRRKDGTIIDVEITSHGLTFNGRPARLVLVKDITERKRAEDELRKAHAELEQRVAERTAELSQANAALKEEIAERLRIEEALQESEARFREMYDEAPVGYHELDADGRITRVNRTELVMLGYTAEEMVGRFVWEFTADPVVSREAVKAKLAGSQPLRPFERVLQRKDGTRFPALIEDRLLRDASGRITGIRSTIQDITDRKRAEEQVRESQQELRDYIDHMSTLNAKVALDGTLLLVNKIAEMGSGLPREQLMRTNFLEGPWWAFDPAVQARVRDAFRRAVAGETVNYDEKVFVFGRVIVINFSLVPVMDEQGRVRYILAEARDITPQKQAEEALRASTAQLEVANRELEAFSYSVSHDLRAPLRSIDGFSRMLLEDYADALDDTGRQYLQRVRAATQRMGYLIDDLLKLARVSRTEIRRERVDLSALARGIIEQQQKAQPDRRVDIHIMDGLTAEGDARLLQIALENLLGNAWKFTSEKPRAVIEFAAQREGDELVYFVRDNGAGFDMTYAHKLFGPFQRLHDATRFDGTGIGLATVQRVIHRHGGRVWAQSSVGEGATFYFTLG
jgi:PAS domain S-box-containing protein